MRNLRWEVDKDLEKLTANKRIYKISRRAKYIIFHLENNNIILHLGMSGSLRIANRDDNYFVKHDHIEFIFDKEKIIYNDPRRFGSIHLAKKIDNHKLIMHLGPEPLSKNFNGKYLYGLCKKSKTNIKSLIMNQKNVVGIGNIYASEALFLAKIKPQKVSKKLTKEDCKVLVTSIKKVLKKAIKKGGSSINDYINVDGKKGYFQYDFKVYGRTNMPCHICQNDILQIKINQRSSFYCKNCQK